MRFIRNPRVRDKIVDVAGKVVLLAISALICLWMISGAKAASPVQISDIREGEAPGGGRQIEFQLSAPLPKDQVAVEFQRNFIQLSLHGVSAFPAKTKSLSHPLLDKVFTYQFQPDLARARVLLKTEAASIQGHTTWIMDGDVLRVTVDSSAVAAAPEVEAPVIKVKAHNKVARKADMVRAEAAAPASPKVDAEDEKLVQQILQDTKAGATPAPLEAKKPVVNPEDQPVFQEHNPAAIATKDAQPKAGKMLASLLMVIGAIGACALAFRRFVLGKGIVPGRQARAIETIASQALGPKRSIALVKVLDRYLVVGMAGDGINLLADLGTDVNVDKYIDEIGPGPSFSQAFRSTVASSDESPIETGTRQKSERREEIGVRAAIKKRIEGFKPL